MSAAAAPAAQPETTVVPIMDWDQVTAAVYNAVMREKYPTAWEDVFTIDDLEDFKPALVEWQLIQDALQKMPFEVLERLCLDAGWRVVKPKHWDSVSSDA